MVVVVEDDSNPEMEVKTGKIAGFDFGLKTFLTCSDGEEIESPQFFKQSLNAIKKASRQHSIATAKTVRTFSIAETIAITASSFFLLPSSFCYKKLKGSSNREGARKNLVRKYEDISNRRRDWFWKLAHELTDKFNILCFETLNLKGMQRLWGRKISDLALGEFLQILEWVAKKKGKQLVFVDQWYPSTKTCSGCGHILESLNLSVREWRCPSCHIMSGRATAIFVGEGSPTIPANNLPSQKPAPTGILWLIDRT